MYNLKRKKKNHIKKSTPMRKWSAFPNSNSDPYIRFHHTWFFFSHMSIFYTWNELSACLRGFHQASAFAFEDNKFCNVVVWMIALGLESLKRTPDPDLCPKFLSTPFRLKRRYSQVRRRIRREELTSRITPMMISSLHRGRWTHSHGQKPLFVKFGKSL